MPEWGKYATGIFYLDKNTHLEAEKDFDTLAASLGIKVLYWRDVPVNANAIGAVARKSEPLTRQVFVTAADGAADKMSQDELTRKVFVLRKRATHELTKPGRRFYICSLSTKTIVYKGLFTSDQVRQAFIFLFRLICLRFQQKSSHSSTYYIRILHAFVCVCARPAITCEHAKKRKKEKT